MTKKHRRHSINSDSEDEPVIDSKGKGKAQPQFRIKTEPACNRIRAKPKALKTEPAMTAVKPPPILDVNPWAKPTSVPAVPAEADATQAQADPALALDLEPTPTKVVAASDQATARGLVFSRQMHDINTTFDKAASAYLGGPVPAPTYEKTEMEWMEVPVLSPVPKEQRDLEYWEAQF
ncbi:TPA: hypothetical protein ACH3X1_004319 [Trebouxia sp. C0004]